MRIFSLAVSLPFPQTLQEVTVPVVSNADCNAAYGSITSNMLCAGRQGKDSCQVSAGTHTRRRCHSKPMLADYKVKQNSLTTVLGTVRLLVSTCLYWFDWFRCDCYQWDRVPFKTFQSFETSLGMLTGELPDRCTCHPKSWVRVKGIFELPKVDPEAGMKWKESFFFLFLLNWFLLTSLVTCTGGLWRPAGDQKRHTVGPGWCGEFWQRLRSQKFSRRLHPSVQLSVLDQQSDQQRPAGFHPGHRHILWRRSAGLPLCSHAVLPPAFLLALSPFIGGQIQQALTFNGRRQATH